MSLPLIALALTLTAEPPLELRMDNFIDNLRQDFAVRSGMAVVMVKGDKVIYRGNFGYADIAAQKAVTDDTRFYIASITKPLFALAWLQAKGPQSLKSTLAEQFPAIPFAPAIEADKVTVKELLTHSAGLSGDLLENAVAITGLHDQPRRRQMLSLLTVNPQAPRGQFQYTNLGYDILGEALSPDWQQLLTDQVLRPLGMTHTSASVPAEAALPYSFFSAQRYQPLYLKKTRQTLHPAGGVFATSGDMAKLLAAELNQGRVDGRQALPAGIIALSQTPAVSLEAKRGDFARTAYALGWYVGQYKGHRTYHHFGSFDGFRPHLSFMPGAGLGLVILDNESELNDKLTDLIADYGYGLMLGEGHLDARLGQRQQALKAMVLGYRQKLLAKEEAYRQRPYQFSQDPRRYTGRYHHPLAGDIVVTGSLAKGFHLSWGPLHSAVTAYGERDSIRVKLRPTHPQVVRFEVADGKVNALLLGGMRFEALALNE
ncbi:serine hydrolase domain-containing protein [Gallaecimonas pentaromativorans]|uniref:serine hydrolase domain-containing protein n=1 Tax=Gallaecimonas pentaromativorans TaxID=584787 RepID=UPI003A8CF7AD